ncbi:MAG: DNA polymerase III subunit alpha [Microbacteriaceae bacterium]|nr:DNA polymerase III subunit alpha [Microbacteriaceae bacterium]
MEVGASYLVTGFTHLNFASAYSAHYGVNRPEQAVAFAKQFGFDALAITDRDGLYGAAKHIAACIENKIDPIIGVSLEVTDQISLGRVVIIAHGHNRGAGWSSLCRIISKAHQKKKNEKPSIDRKDLAELAQQEIANCTVLIGPDSDVGKAALFDPSKASVLLDGWLEHFNTRGCLAIEVFSHLTEPGTSYSNDHARALISLADYKKLPAVLTNAARYLEPDDALTADVLDSARYLEPLGIFLPQPNAQAWLKPPNDMASLALEITGDTKMAKKLLSTTEQLTDRCRINPVEDCDWGNPKTPEKQLLGIEGNPFEVLWQKTHSAIDYRYPGAKPSLVTEVQHQLSKELITINKLGFSTFFLTVADVAQMIRDMRIRIAARGSGAGSLVNYLLGISHIDPIEQGLLFERFLSTERSTLPDIDIDVESSRRHEIYRAIFKRYGGDRVTLLSMQSTYRGRGAIRDSGLALGLDEDQIDQIAKSSWRFSARSFRAALEVKPELAKLANQVGKNRKLNLLVDLTQRLDRLPRHISMHPCGVILGDNRLLDLTPTEPSGLGLPMSQFDKDDMDPLGFLKLDVLGVRMQSTMAYAVKEIERVENKTLDLDSVATDDKDVFQLIRTTNTLGIFQIESPGQRELTGKHQPTEFNDLTLQISLFRPGPMKGNMISPYLDGRHGFIQPDYFHPDLKPILEESYGVVVFHEQLMRIMKVMTGCTLAKADEMRRKMAKPALKQDIETYFKQSSLARGYQLSVVNRVWQVLEGFGSFGFCKAHGAAFALPTYQSAWLKTHYPAEFISGILTHDPGMYPKRLLLAEARRLGVELWPIDVNKSTDEYFVEVISGAKGVRMSLIEIAGISTPEIQRIIKNAPFRDIADFYTRARPSRKTIMRLATIGALDSLSTMEATRGDVIQKIREITTKPAPNINPSQNELDFSVTEQLPEGNPDFTHNQQLELEMGLTGMDISGHLLDKYLPMLDDLGVSRANELNTLRGNTEVLIAGIRVATQTPPMRSGKRVVFISLDDGTGCADATFFDEAQARCSDLLFNNRLLLISGKLRRTGKNGVSVLAENAWDLNQLWIKWERGERLAG